jgi:Tfp pilus assembly protein PilV
MRRGSTLVEALVACLVLGLGVLAWLRLPALTARELADARARQDAAHAVAALAAALHAQHDYGADPVARGLHRALLPAPRHPGFDCLDADCTPAQMADEDLRLWSELAAARLPGARAQLDCRPPPARAPAPPWPGGCMLRLRLAPAASRDATLLQWRLQP